MSLNSFYYKHVLKHTSIINNLSYTVQYLYYIVTGLGRWSVIRY